MVRSFLLIAAEGTRIVEPAIFRNITRAAIGFADRDAPRWNPSNEVFMKPCFGRQIPMISQLWT
jgi:hypothetical protein